MEAAQFQFRIVHMSHHITASFSSPEHGTQEFKSAPYSFSNDNPSQSYAQVSQCIEAIRKQTMDHFNSLLFANKIDPKDIEPDDPETMANNDDEVDLAPPPPED